MSMRIAVFASGRGSNFEALASADLSGSEISLLCSDVEDTPARNTARRLGIRSEYIFPGPRRTVFSAEAEAAWCALLECEGIELVCLAGLMRMLRNGILDKYAGRILNVHPSLLPAFPGLDAQGQALRYGAKVSGCTVHYVDAGMDSGPIIMQAPVIINDWDTVETLSGRILEQEHRIYPESVRLHCSGRLLVEGRRVSTIPADPGARSPSP